MRSLFIFAALTMGFFLVPAEGQTADQKLQDSLMAMEKAAWDAFAKGDGKFFETFLTEDGMVMSDMGTADRAQLVKDISTKPCDVKSYSFSNYKVTMLDPNVALATYEATQSGTCGTQAMPPKVLASTVFVKRKGKWLGAFHQETAAMKAPGS